MTIVGHPQPDGKNPQIAAPWHERVVLARAVLAWRFDVTDPDVRCVLDVLDGMSLDDLAMKQLGIDVSEAS